MNSSELKYSNKYFFLVLCSKSGFLGRLIQKLKNKSWPTKSVGVCGILDITLQGPSYGLPMIELDRTITVVLHNPGSFSGHAKNAKIFKFEIDDYF